jgi:hypothetical protein
MPSTSGMEHALLDLFCIAKNGFKVPAASHTGRRRALPYLFFVLQAVEPRCPLLPALWDDPELCLNCFCIEGSGTKVPAAASRMG